MSCSVRRPCGAVAKIRGEEGEAGSHAHDLAHDDGVQEVTQRVLVRPRSENRASRRPHRRMTEHFAWMQEVHEAVTVEKLHGAGAHHEGVLGRLPRLRQDH